MANKKPYGYIYDKQGNKREVFPPVNSKGQPIKPHTKTMTGAIGRGVGYSMSPERKSI
jgi:hypothetical protein